MITKQTAKQNNIKIIDSKNRLDDDKTSLIEQLKALLPNVINSDNQLDTKALADVVDLANTTSNNQGYELTFAGKGIARALASKPTELELKAELKQSKDFDNTKNTVIRGDNLEVLKILQSNYHNKIKMIYIDPPYNTKNENFIYKDNFKQSDADLIENFALDEDAVDFLQNVYGTRSHSGWLSFIYPRLKLARDLLTDDGVIFISIDDNEQANLKILCDEIFGEDNFVDCIVWQRKRGRDNSAKWFSKSHEYLLVYAKNKSNLCIKTLDINNETKKAYKNPDNDKRGVYRMLAVWARGTQGGVKYSFINKGGQEFSERLWLYSKKNLALMDEENKLTVRGDNLYRKMFLSEHKGRIAETIWSDVSNTANASDEIKTLFGNIIFDTSKPIPFLQQILKLTTDKNNIVLDFFAGSGTTADAVMQLNAQDGGNRKFVLVQIDEKIDKKKSAEAHKFCIDSKFEPVISSITLERLNRAGEKIKADFEQNQKGLFDDKKLPDIGYKVFSCVQKPKVSQQEAVFLVENQRKTSLNTLINMLVATCKTLDSKIICLQADKLYQVDNEIYLLANVEKQILAKYQDAKINLDGWADIDLTQYLNLDIKNNDNISVIY